MKQAYHTRRLAKPHRTLSTAPPLPTSHRTPHQPDHGSGSPTVVNREIRLTAEANEVGHITRVDDRTILTDHRKTSSTDPPQPRHKSPRRARKEGTGNSQGRRGSTSVPSRPTQLALSATP